jgi:hypothetical protein
MTPQAFVAKCHASSEDERRHLNDLGGLLGTLPNPATTADPGFGSEKGAAKATDGSGRANVWRRGLGRTPAASARRT